MTRTLMLILITAGVLGFSSCNSGDATAPTNTAPSAVSVTVATIEKAKVRSFVRKTAKLQARTDVTLMTESAGLVMERPKPAGSQVEAGEVILRLSDAAQQATLKAARARLSMLAVEATDLSVREAAEAEVEAAQERLRMRTVRTPAAGVIDRYDMELGDHAMPGMPVGRLVDRTKLYFIATVLESEVLRIALNGVAPFKVPAHPGVIFEGKVIRRGQAALRGSGQFEVEVSVGADQRLRPGFLVNVELPLADALSIRAIPAEAVFTRHGTQRVFVVDAESQRAREHAVLTRNVPGRPELVDVIKGLSEGERVVVRGRLGLKEGDLLDIKER